MTTKLILKLKYVHCLFIVQQHASLDLWFVYNPFIRVFKKRFLNLSNEIKKVNVNLKWKKETQFKFDLPWPRYNQRQYNQYSAFNSIRSRSQSRSLHIRKSFPFKIYKKVKECMPERYTAWLHNTSNCTLLKMLNLHMFLNRFKAFIAKNLIILYLHYFNNMPTAIWCF